MITRLKTSLIASYLIGSLLFSAFAGNTGTSTTGVSGYDLISYHMGAKTLERPMETMLPCMMGFPTYL